MPRYTRIHRLLKITTLIQSGPGYTVGRLAEECAVAERTVFRDLQELKGAGIPVRFDDRTGAYTIDRGFFFPPVALAPNEAIALALLCERIAAQNLVPGTLPAGGAMAKIKSLLSPAMRAEVERIVQASSVRHHRLPWTDEYTAVYTTVQQAIGTRRALLLRLRASNSHAPEEFDFEPYALVLADCAWHVVGHDADHPALRTIRLSRVAIATLTHRPYEIPPGFSADDHFGNAWRTSRGEQDFVVELRIEAPFADAVAEATHHRTQSVEHNPDGSLTYRCTVAGLDEVVWWVLSMGRHCRVVAPCELKARVSTAARELVGMYDGECADAPM